jgi:hypothetical protein
MGLCGRDEPDNPVHPSFITDENYSETGFACQFGRFRRDAIIEKPAGL